MINIVKSDSRGKSETEWLESYHSFSFSEYYDEDNINFGPLRVINHDFISPSSGFPTHPHDNMEIVTYVIKGTLTHTDSMGTKKNIVKNEVQKMTAGTGLYHSEFNYSKDEPVELIQIWIIPEKQGLSPKYSQEIIPENAAKNKLYKIVSHISADGLLKINQMADIFIAELDEAKEIDYEGTTGDGTYVYLISGEINVNDTTLKQGDAAKVLNEKELKIRANVDSKVMLFNVNL